MPGEPLTTRFDRWLLWARVDPERTTIISVAALAMIGLAGHFLFQGPAPASAFFVPPAPSSNSADPALPAAPDQSSVALLEWLKQPPQTVHRNLFSLDLGDAASSPDKMLWDQLAKSLWEQADQNRQRQGQSRPSIPSAR